MILSRQPSIIFIVFFTVYFSFYSLATAEPQPSNLTEYHPQILFPFTYKQLGSIFTLCIQDKGCEITPSEKNLIEAIQSSLTTESKLNSEPIQFDSSKKNPILFLKDGNTRIAVTGDNIGDTIFINLDLVFQNDKYNHPHPLHLDRVIAILTHELGHHHGIKNHSDLDQLGLKIGTYFLSKIQWTAINGDSGENQDPATRPLLIFLGSVSFPFTDSPQTGLQNLIWIFDEYKIIDITDKLTALIHCSDSSVAQSSRLLNWESSSWRFGESNNDIHKCSSTGAQNATGWGINYFTLNSSLQLVCFETLQNLNISVELGFHKNCSNETLFGSNDANFFLFEGINKLKIIRSTILNTKLKIIFIKILNN